MKKLLWTSLCCAGALLTACSDETGFASTDTGTLKVSLDVDRSILTAGQSRSSLEEASQNLSTADFTIRLTNADGEIKEWPYESFTGQNIAIGRYTLSAYAGKEGDEGFNKPYFLGSEEVNVLTDQTTPVAITAALANSAVRVEYTEAFRKYMTEYTASVRTDGSTDGVAYPATASADDDLFINPGDASLYVTFTNVNGQSATLKAAEFTAEPRHRYTVTVDVNGGEIADAVLNVTFDDSTVAETREFVLSDELFNAPAPIITPELQEISVVEGGKPAEGGKVNIIAAGGLASVKLVTGSDYLLANGWPAEVDLLKAGTDMQQLLRRYGLNVIGLWNNPDKAAVIDFTGTIAALHSAADNTTTFRIEVEDNYGKVSDPAAIINVSLDPLEFSIAGQDLCMTGAESVTLNLTYNGTEVDKIKWEVFHNAAGVWDTVTPTSVKAISRSGEATYAVTLPIPAGNDDVKVRATLGSMPQINFTVTRREPDFTVNVADNNAYATRAYVELSSSEVSGASLIKFLKFTATAEGTPVSGMSAKKVADNLIELSGLPAGKNVTVKATLISKEATTTFTTESPSAIPNGDFETLNAALNLTGLNQGGRWKESAFSSWKQTKCDIDIKEPAGWATVNAKTAAASHSTRNTWFVVPSTVNTTLTWLSTVPQSTVGSNGGTDTPDAFKGLTPQSGSNAMVLRNVAWDAKGSLPGDKSYLAANYDQYVNNNAPSSIANRSAGKLFLGSYSYANGTETYNEGVSFTSRPSSLTGYYKFERDNADPNETGMVTVQVLSGATVIANATLQLDPAAEYTPFTVPLTYAAGAPKATQVRVMFASSNHASYSQAEETAAIKTTNRSNRYENYSLGAALTVDNLAFNY